MRKNLSIDLQNLNECRERGEAHEGDGGGNPGALKANGKGEQRQDHYRLKMQIVSRHHILGNVLTCTW